MSYYDIYDSGFTERNKGHFAAIVRVALADGNFSEEEMQFINELKIKLDISDEDYEKILANPNNYPVNPPYLQTQRIERLYDLARMVFVNHVLGQKQKDILRKFTSALGFSGNINKLTDKALSLLVLEVDYETFQKEIELFIKEENKKEQV
jgi:uncharacterized membrane protein YebE (DUF533 family)